MKLIDFCYFFAGQVPVRWPNTQEMMRLGPFAASVWKEQAYQGSGGSPYPPYDWQEASVAELRYIIAGARALQPAHIVCPYSSWFYAKEKMTRVQFTNEVRRIKAISGCTGLYVDGLSFPYNARQPWSQEENREVARILRNNIFGATGMLILHSTQRAQDGTFFPPDLEAERFFSLVVIGEGAPSWSDQEACKEYMEAQIQPRIDAGIPWAMLKQDWPADWLAQHGASAVGHMGYKMQDGTFTDGQTTYYKRLMAARAVFT